jgi:hypothetical protein
MFYVLFPLRVVYTQLFFKAFEDLQRTVEIISCKPETNAMISAVVCEAVTQAWLRWNSAALQLTLQNSF